MSKAETKIAYTAELDARDLRCPLPLLKAKHAMRSLQEGEVLRVMATDPAAPRDFQTWERLSQHRLLHVQEEQAHYILYMQK